MGKTTITPTGVERTFAPNEFIVSKTDTTGRLTYVNKTFMEIADYTEVELHNQQHNIIRHPDMPRGVFKLLWDSIQAGKEIFAYVINMTKFGDHYWVIAHVTPSYDTAGQNCGYHSNRRVPSQSALEVIKPIYREMLSIEARSRKDGPSDSVAYLQSILDDKGISYDEFIFGLK